MDSGIDIFRAELSAGRMARTSEQHIRSEKR
jgi:hypothetical protein